MNPEIFSSLGGSRVARNVPCGILKFEVNSPTDGSVDAYFIQIHDAWKAPTTADVPKKSWPATQCQYKEFKNGELELTKGCVVVLSTTERTYTAQATAFGTIQIEFTQPPPTESNTNATGVKSLVVWANTETHRIKLIRLKRLAAADALMYLQIYAVGASTSSIVVSIPISSMAANEQQEFSLGTSGLLLGIKTSTEFCTGCTVFLSTTAWTTTAPADTFDISVDYVY